MSSPIAKLNQPKVLVVDDHVAARESIAAVLGAAGCIVSAAASVPEALALADGDAPDVIVTDLCMPGMSGLDLVREVERRRLATRVLVVTGHASISTAVEALRHGASDYLEKPFDADRLEKSVRQALDQRRLMRGPGGADFRQEETPSNRHDPPLLVGSSPAMQELRARIASVAATDETVLISGESGTGKELVARTIHRQSRRAAGPLVSLNCPVLSAQLMESELFGHERGAFTGADSTRIGRFEAAQGGTLLLDEITEIDLRLQAKLLRVLQERCFERVGASEPICGDARVLATTNRDPQQAIAAGVFRADLYYRLAVVPIEVPPLRERRSDIAELIDDFLSEAARRLGRSPCALGESAYRVLEEYDWPGNVRELQNLVVRASVLLEGKRILADDLRGWLRPPENAGAGLQLAPPPDKSSLADVERRHIERTLLQFGGHREKTARALGIGVRTLSGKLRQYGYAAREKCFAATTEAAP